MLKLVKYIIFSIIIIFSVNFISRKVEPKEVDLTPEEVEFKWEKEKKELKKESKIIWYEIKKFIIKLKEKI